MQKAVKEAKLRTSWINPNEAYDGAIRLFVARILDPGISARFLDDFAAFHRPVARLGMINSLSQTLIKITAPGIPDFYQGTEIWDFSLVDPDNRRPVDFVVRAALLEGLQERFAAGDLARMAAELVDRWEDGRIKLYTVHRALACRRAAASLFREGEYVALPTGGRRGIHVCAFARQRERQVVLIVVPRLLARLTDNGMARPLGRECWADTWVELPDSIPSGVFRHLFTGATVAPIPGDSRTALLVGDLLAEFPVALLEGLPTPPVGANGNRDPAAVGVHPHEDTIERCEIHGTV
jgi:(1->4)-alpha-D-glucan 1-alpha-D-glucosylmutase